MSQYPFRSHGRSSSNLMLALIWLYSVGCALSWLKQDIKVRNVRAYNSPTAGSGLISDDPAKDNDESAASCKPGFSLRLEHCALSQPAESFAVERAKRSDHDQYFLKGQSISNHMDNLLLCDGIAHRVFRRFLVQKGHFRS